jgi:hypothetical protein
LIAISSVVLKDSNSLAIIIHSQSILIHFSELSHPFAAAGQLSIPAISVPAADNCAPARSKLLDKQLDEILFRTLDLKGLYGLEWAARKSKSTPGRSGMSGEDKQDPKTAAAPARGGKAIGRRDILQGLSAVPVLGLFGYAVKERPPGAIISA